MSVTSSDLAFIAQVIKEAECRVSEERGIRIQLRATRLYREGSSSDAEEIIMIVADELGIPMEAICGKERHREIVEARYIACHLIWKTCVGLSLAQTGRLFGGKDHSTVVHMRRTVTDLLDTQDAQFLPKFIRCQQAVSKWLAEKQEAGNE